MNVSDLKPEHHGAHARIALAPGDIREGQLSRGRNSSYPGRDIRHWWLLVPSALPHFDHDALSLQWSGHATVELIDADPIPPEQARTALARIAAHATDNTDRALLTAMLGLEENS